MEVYVYNQICPVLFLQEEVNAQGENVYRLRKTEGTTTNVDPLMLGSLTDYFKNQTNVMPKFAPPVGPQAFNRVQPNMQLPLSNIGVNNKMMPTLEQTQQPQMVQYEDASRDNKPYNQGFLAFDPTNQYVGRYTVIDQIHDSTKTQNPEKTKKTIIPGARPISPVWGLPICALGGKTRCGDRPPIKGILLLRLDW